MSPAAHSAVTMHSGIIPLLVDDALVDEALVEAAVVVALVEAAVVVALELASLVLPLVDAMPPAPPVPDELSPVDVVEPADDVEVLALLVTLALDAPPAPEGTVVHDAAAASAMKAPHATALRCTPVAAIVPTQTSARSHVSKAVRGSSTAFSPPTASERKTTCSTPLAQARQIRSKSSATLASSSMIDFVSSSCCAARR